MMFEEKENYVFLEVNDENIIESLSTKIKKWVNKNCVVQLSENLNISNEKFFLFLDIAQSKKKNGTSFVIVKNGLDLDLIPEELNVVPTLTEAEDIIEMEAIERDLGF